MLHEMCHQLAYEMGIKDTSRHGYYHNHNFRTIAEAHGLIVKRVPQYGWTDTYLKQSTYRLIKERYPDKVSLIFHKTQLELYMDWLKEQGVESSDETSAKISGKDLLDNFLSKSTSTRKYSCPRCGNSVRATKEVYIICGDCNAKMTLAPKKKYPAKG